MTSTANTGPSEHLSWDELACRDAARTPYPAQWRADRAVELAKAFEAVRLQYGAAIKIASAYRTPEHNRRVGGARLSQHMEGRALDLRPLVPGPVALKSLIAAALRVRAASPNLITGFAIYGSFIHIDTRPGRAVRWSGSRVDAEKPLKGATA